MKCKECGYELSNDVKFCGKCGKPVTSSISSSINKIKCEECGSEIDNDLKFCPKCGKPVSFQKYDNRKNRRGGKRDKDDDEDDEDGGILGGVGDFIGKIFG